MDTQIAWRLKIVVLLSLALCLAVLILMPINQSMQKRFAEREMSETITSGEISRKELVNPTTGLFTSTDAEYRLYIEYTWEYDDEEITSEKYFSVPLEVYNAYDIGDTFDSAKLH